MLTNQQVSSIMLFVLFFTLPERSLPMEDRFESFALTIAELNRSVQRIKPQEMARFGLKGSHTMCLYTLGKHPEGLTSAQLAALCKEDKAAISRTLAQLEERKLVRVQQQNGKIEYRALLFLTQDGHSVVEQMSQAVEAALQAGGAGLTDWERQTFYQALARIDANLKQWLAR
jgi:DNA-binding MarR family transcriptional regulator